MSVRVLLPAAASPVAHEGIDLDLDERVRVG